MTFLEMQDLALYWLDDVDAGYFTRPQIKQWINNAQQEVAKVIEQAFEGHFIKTVETTLVPNQREYELPTDFKRLHRLEVVLSGATFTTQNVTLLAKITPNQQDGFARSGSPVAYFFKGTQLILVPTPDLAKTLRMDYTYRLADLSGNSDVSEIPIHYHEYVSLLGARAGLAKDGRDITTVQKMIDDYETGLKRDAEQRNVDSPRTVVQTIDDDSYDEWW